MRLIRLLLARLCLKLGKWLARLGEWLVGI